MKLLKPLLIGALGAALLASPLAPVQAKTPGAKTGPRHELNKQLGLSKDQKQGLRPIRRDAKEQIRAIKADKSLSKKERKARLRAVRANRDAQMNKILTPDQQRKLADYRAQKRAQKRAAKGKA